MLVGRTLPDSYGDGVLADYVVRRDNMSSKSARFVPSIRLAQYDVVNKKGEDMG